MNTSDRQVRSDVGFLHCVPKEGCFRVDLVDFLNRKPESAGLGVGVVANIHLMQEGPERGPAARARTWLAGGLLELDADHVDVL